MKECLKRLAAVTALILVFPAYLMFHGQRLLGSPQQAFQGWSQLFSLFPGTSGAYLRHAFYRLVFPRCAAAAWISFGVLFSHPTARVGSNVYIGNYCVLGDVTLEDDVLLASHVSITNGGSQHGTDVLDRPIREQAGDWPRITVGHDTWIGERAVVMADVGRHCIIGAGAVVNRPIPDYAVAVGVPAKVIRCRKPAG